MDTPAPSLHADPIISVCVITYNHAKYIIDCLEGIRKQVGAPQFEVVICDDASSDNTGSIIRSYIDNNQLYQFKYHRAESNRGMMANLTAALRLCRGEFIAICEGDDYWTDSEKLKKQYSIMSNNPGCAICTHSGFITGPSRTTRKAFNRGNSIRRFDLREILCHSSTQFSPTASYMIRTNVVSHLPNWFSSAPIGDLFLELLSLKQGYGIHIPETMSAYRVFSTGSWSSRMKNDRQRSIDHGNRMLKIISILEADEQFRENGLNVLAANVNSLLAIDFLLCRNYKEFRRYIEESFSLSSRHQPRTARYLYRMRRIPSVAHFLYRIRRTYFS